MKHKITSSFFFILFIFSCWSLYSQPTEQRVKVIVAPDHSDWTYKVNEKVKFTISVIQDGNPL